MATRFQQLGAFVGEIEKVSDERLAAFAACGGLWTVPLVAQLGYPDDHDPACVANLANLDSFVQRCAAHGIACGGWFNGWVGGTLGTSPSQDAVQVASIVHSHALTGPVMLDLESPYHAAPQDVPQLVAECRRLMPTRGLCVSTNEPNDSMIWNGGNLGAAKSMRALGVRLAPQWYNSPNYSGMWMHSDQTMAWLYDHGAEDNFYDPVPLNHRAVPLSFVHGTLEVTGLEGSDLASELTELRAARSHGYTTGFSVYLLEDMPDSDFALLASVRGNLFLG